MHIFISKNTIIFQEILIIVYISETNIRTLLCNEHTKKTALLGMSEAVGETAKIGGQ